MPSLLQKPVLQQPDASLVPMISTPTPSTELSKPEVFSSTLDAIFSNNTHFLPKHLPATSSAPEIAHLEDHKISDEEEWEGAIVALEGIAKSVPTASKVSVETAYPGNPEKHSPLAQETPIFEALAPEAQAPEAPAAPEALMQECSSTQVCSREKQPTRAECKEEKSENIAAAFSSDDPGRTKSKSPAPCTVKSESVYIFYELSYAVG